jgi:hypothetical protein
MSAVPQRQLPARHMPSRLDMLVFDMKASAFRLLRRLGEIATRTPVNHHDKAAALAHAPIVAAVRSPLWTAKGGDKEQALTAGKVQNLRIALQGLDGIEVGAGAVFSFWKQVGKPVARRGFVKGRELREGCFIASTGGGLCQLSNALYEAALKAGFSIVECHAHSRIVPGSRAAHGRDATVFWNYVDLRFAAPHAFRIEARLTARDLEIVIRSRAGASAPVVNRDGPDERATAQDCNSCNETGCHMHDPDLTERTRRPTAWLVDAVTPEFAKLVSDEGTPFDALFVPLKSKRPRYRWPAGACGTQVYAPLVALARALRLRYAPQQGRALQSLLMTYDEKLARHYAKRLSYLHNHVVVSQSLLPHLWSIGALQGRTFEVLMDRWPMGELQARLDDALLHYPESPTLGDFRAPAAVVAAEAQALKAAERLYTPHAEVARLFPKKTVLLKWIMPNAPPLTTGGRTILFPASALGRKGAYQLREALQGLDMTLLVSGTARETTANFWGDIDARPLTGPLPDRIAAIVLPAIVEHQPRALLRGLAAGVPVIATTACGLGSRTGLTIVPLYDAYALRQAILTVLKRSEKASERSAA